MIYHENETHMVDELRIIFGNKVEYIRGANSIDETSLYRLKRIFQKSSDLLTNGISTHVAYALFEGLFVKVVDDPLEVELFDEESNEIPNRRKLLPLYTDFHKDIDLGREMLGANFKKSRSEIINIFRLNKSNFGIPYLLKVGKKYVLPRF